MKFHVNVYRDATNYDEESIRMDVNGDELDEALTAVKMILLHAEVDASVFIKRVKE